MRGRLGVRGRLSTGGRLCRPGPLPGWLRGRSLRDRGTRERGSLAIEMVILTPILVIFMMVLVALGRIVEAQGQVDGAARDAARAASISQSSGGAAQNAQLAAVQDLNGSSRCTTSPAVSFAAGTDLAPGGQVNVVVQCSISLPGLSFIGFGTRTITGHGSAPIDVFSVGG
jgi:Flp pilus assembly protein TadG